MTNLITLAGEGTRFSVDGVPVPKPLIPVDGIPMIVRAVDCLPRANKNVFVCRSEHVTDWSIDKLLNQHFNDCEFVILDKTTQGQACTAEIGINESSIKLSDSILISCCDYGLEWDVSTYNKLKGESDIVVWSTTHNKAFAKNPAAYSWLELDGNTIIRAHVKESIFDDAYNSTAIVGTFYFRKAKHFIDSLQPVYKNNITSNGEFYIDNIFNTVKNLNVNAFTVNRYHCWGTPQDLQDYEHNILGQIN